MSTQQPGDCILVNYVSRGRHIRSQYHVNLKESKIRLWNEATHSAYIKKQEKINWQLFSITPNLQIKWHSKLYTWNLTTQEANGLPMHQIWHGEVVAQPETLPQLILSLMCKFWINWHESLSNPLFDPIDCPVDKNIPGRWINDEEMSHMLHTWIIIVLISQTTGFEYRRE